MACPQNFNITVARPRTDFGDKTDKVGRPIAREIISHQITDFHSRTFLGLLLTHSYIIHQVAARVKNFLVKKMLCF